MCMRESICVWRDAAMGAAKIWFVQEIVFDSRWGEYSVWNIFIRMSSETHVAWPYTVMQHSVNSYLLSPF